jgi:hypothetical protein
MIKRQFHHSKQQFTVVKWDIFFVRVCILAGFSPHTLDYPHTLRAYRTSWILLGHTGFSPRTLVQDSQLTRVENKLVNRVQTSV